MDGLEKARESGEFREVEDKEKLFVIKQYSREGKTYFLDLRDGELDYYAYGIHEKIPRDKLKQEPRCVKEVRSYKEAEGSEGLDSFV